MTEQENGAPEGSRGGLKRRQFIKGVIAGGAVVASAGYLFRSDRVASAPGRITRAAGIVER